MLSKQVLTGFMVTVLSVSVAQAAQEEGTASTFREFSLSQILRLALERNPSMTVSREIVDEKRGGQRSSVAYPNPNLAFDFGHGESRDPDIGESIFERFIFVRQPLEWPGKRSARRQAADAGFNSAQSGVEETKLNLTAAVKLAFYEVLLSKRRAELAGKNLNLLKDISRAVRVRVRAGEAAPFEEVKVAVEVLKAQRRLTSALGSLLAANASLDALTVGALGTEFNVRGDFESWPSALELKKLSERALDQHPSLAKFKKLVTEASHRYRFERQARVPNVQAMANYQRDLGREAVNFGLSADIPLWYLRQGEIGQALAVQRQREARLVRVQTEIVRDLTRNFQLSKAAASQIRTYEVGLLKQAREALRIAEVSFRFGQASLLETLDAQRVLWDTFVGYAEARFDLSVAMAKLERSVGGPL